MAKKSHGSKKFSKSSNKKIISSTSELKNLSMVGNDKEKIEVAAVDEYDKDTFEADALEPSSFEIKEIE